NVDTNDEPCLYLFFERLQSFSISLKDFQLGSSSDTQLIDNKDGGQLSNALLYLYVMLHLWKILLIYEELCTKFSNSERSDECIDFTMLCVFLFFYLSEYSITSRYNAPISNFGGGFRCKSEYPWCIIEFSKKSRITKKKKNYGKTGIFTQNQFSTKSIFLCGCNSKTNHCKNLKLSPNKFESVDKKILDDQKVPHKIKITTLIAKS
ncbi:Uncharacterized protein FWK35_00026615, partial [Aphis craccivora]